MEKKIRIVSTPPGFADESIRKQWVGLELPLATEDEVRMAAAGSQTDPSDIEGYLVRGDRAVIALSDAQKFDAAAFWGNPAPPRMLEFPADCCEEVQ